MLGLFLLGGMLVVSLLYFGDLGLKRVLLFNAVFWALMFTPIIGIPGFVVLLGQVMVFSVYMMIAKTGM